MIRLLYILAVAFAILAVQTDNMRRAVIYVGIFSLVISLCYIFYSAPDVAIAQAVIASTLGTILYLVALQKKKVVMIYYTNEDQEMMHDGYTLKGSTSILKDIEGYYHQNGLDCEVVYTTNDLEYIKQHQNYDLIVRQKGSKVSIYEHKKNHLLDQSKNFIEGNKAFDITICNSVKGGVE
ncbi:multisubunit sodium/proton antiporter [Clostridium aceticum]|uniref:Multisubunit sodium/proton antiporter n=1 Tax=Clostridium aceticum TaxID=84022 RepID=A0A0G3WCK7_9CLOT|nr:DUF4040 domain-containing protein [Clostridium aceticum]AKL96416.1 multisubunit sodium/proton antiporter [Clostridium aceticum]